jgi:predicted acyltransferase
MSKRLISLDVLRGVTIAGMILVNDPGSWEYVYAPLRHATWHGCTPTDLVFPFFLFMVGMAITIALGKRMSSGDDTSGVITKIVRRSVIIFLIGMLLNGFPYYDLTTIRIPGVLQRIAIVYLVCALIFINTSWVGQLRWAISLLVAYWFMMNFIPVPGVGAPNLEPTTNLGAWLDNLLLGGHLWSSSRVWDPEGILSTLPAICTGLSGVLAGHLVKSQIDETKKVVWLFTSGAFCILLGLLWDLSFPINKYLWTSSYVLYTTGIAMQCLAVCYWFIDVLGYKGWTTPWVAFGMNALSAYVLSGLLARLLGLIQIGDQSLKAWIFNNLFVSWLDPYNASLAFAIVFVLCLFIPSWALYKKGIILKV